jgi:hypothetical protein
MTDVLVLAIKSTVSASAFVGVFLLFGPYVWRPWRDRNKVVGRR